MTSMQWTLFLMYVNTEFLGRQQLDDTVHSYYLVQALCATATRLDRIPALTRYAL